MTTPETHAGQAKETETPIVDGNCGMVTNAIGEPLEAVPASLARDIERRLARAVEERKAIDAEYVMVCNERDQAERRLSLAVEALAIAERDDAVPAGMPEPSLRWDFSWGCMVPGTAYVWAADYDALRAYAEKAASRERVALEAGYRLGFDASGEGWNGEYFKDTPDNHAAWYVKREQKLRAIAQLRDESKP